MTRVVRRSLIAVAVLVAIGVAVFIRLATGLTPYLRDHVVEALNARFSSKVDLKTLQVSAFPRPEVYGEGLEVRYNGRTDVPPLISIPSFSASAGIFGLRSNPLRLNTVELDGLDIHIPVGGLNPGRKPAAPGEGPRIAPPAPTPGHDHENPSALTIERLLARSATLEIASKDPLKLPRRFEIHDLEMLELGGNDGAKFRAALTNPKPHGRIDAEGTFGPWHKDEPRLTPIRGDYLFGSANLDTIKGIGGTLSSAGTYKGTLERIDVTGHTETPDFVIDIAGHPMPLTTTFAAVVDATNGDTWLERVEAKIGNTTILAQGAVVRAREVKGRHIALDVQIENGRLEDLMALAVKAAKPPVTGRVAIKTKLVIPAGEQDVAEKLQLAGEFALAEAQFTNLNVQQRINVLSKRAKGDEAADNSASVVSNLRGRFVMRDAAIHFSSLTFAIPGAVVQLAGSYDLRSELVDFNGDLLLDASLAEMTTGVKSIAARIVQPFFRRPGGGSKLPIRISGPRAKPSFGLNVKRAFLPG